MPNHWLIGFDHLCHVLIKSDRFGQIVLWMLKYLAIWSYWSNNFGHMMPPASTTIVGNPRNHIFRCIANFLAKCPPMAPGTLIIIDFGQIWPQALSFLSWILAKFNHFLAHSSSGTTTPQFFCCGHFRNVSRLGDPALCMAAELSRAVGASAGGGSHGWTRWGGGRALMSKFKYYHT